MATLQELEARIAALEAVVQQILDANRKIEGDVFAPGVSVGVNGDGDNPSPGNGQSGGGTI